MDTLDLPTARCLAAEVVAQTGPCYVYTNPDANGTRTYCDYWHVATNEPGCVVGKILSRHGYSGEYLSGLTGSIGAPGHASERLPDVTQDARDYLSTLQSYQDNGVSWGHALTIAEGELPA